MQEKDENEYCPKYKWNSNNAFENDTESDDFEDEIFNYAKDNIAYITLFIHEAFAEKILISEKISRFHLCLMLEGYLDCSWDSVLLVLLKFCIMESR